MEIISKCQELSISIGLYKRWRVATGFVMVFFLVSLSGLIYPPLEEWSAKFANRNYNGEGLIEILEAICWFSASLIYFLLLIRNVRQHGWNLTSLWFLFFTCFCFAAFGEEVSWGQHIFNFQPNETIIAYNEQKEFNIHNLNLAKIFHLQKDFNLTFLLNPLFYATCGIFWLIIPLLKKAGKLTRNRIFSALPAPSFPTVIFLGVNIAVYLVVDKLFFDVGEIFELALALTGLMVPLDILLKESIQPNLPTPI